MIEVRDLSKAYGHTLAFDHLSFSVKPGTVSGFLGPNGAGKSTTMRMILGLDNPTSGTALIDGKPYAQLHRPLTKVGSLLDANWIHPNRSAKAHLSWLAVSNGLARGRVGEVLDLVGLAAVADKSAGKFSLGMKQRLGLAAALLGDPEILLFDEPVNGLDPEGILWIRTFMRRLAEQGRTVLVSSHLLSEMALTADHLIVIGKGRLIADASTADFIAASTSSTVRVRSPRLSDLQAVLTAQNIPTQVVDGALVVSGAPIEQIGDLAAASGIALHELSPQRGSLEEAFMQLTGETAEFHSHDGGGAVPPGGPSGVVPPPGSVPLGAPPGAPAFAAPSPVPTSAAPTTPQGR